MMYFVELTNNHLNIELGRLYVIRWSPDDMEWRVVFPRESKMLGHLNVWEDKTGYVVNSQLV